MSQFGRHLTGDAFRKAGYQAVDWVARYLDDLETRPVLAQVMPGEVRARLPRTPPPKGESWDAVLRDLDDIILPGITHWQSPNFFAYFPANASGPAILGDLIASGLGVQGMLWSTSPACTELETHVLDWLVGMLGLPEQFRSTADGGGVIQDTASSATLCALLAARERASEFQTGRQGVRQRFTAYTSTQGHSSVEKAIRIAGVGSDNLRHVEVDEQYAMLPDALERQITTDVESGFTPCFVCATVGTTSSTAIDPIRQIGEVCRRHAVWLHVDAALAGSAAVCPEYRWIHDGLELADSYCFNPHKWMLTNFDCDCFYVADRAVLTRTLSVLPEYLRNQPTESGTVFDYRDWHVPLGRRFRALKLWFVIRHYGVDGLRQYIQSHVALAQEVKQWVENDARFELAAPVPLNLVCFRHKGSDRINEEIMNHLNQSGAVHLTHTKLGGKMVLRLAIGGTYTERRHVVGAWRLISDAADDMVSESEA
jgi:aromatic-L-amino-acid decarboxylase